MTLLEDGWTSDSAGKSGWGDDYPLGRVMGDGCPIAELDFGGFAAYHG